MLHISTYYKHLFNDDMNTITCDSTGNLLPEYFCERSTQITDLIQ